MTLHNKAIRLGSLLLAALVATITLSVVVHATQVITTPNAAFFTYSLASGANSAPITPVANQSVLVMGNCTTFNFRGVGFVTLLRIPASFLEWVGLESTSGAAITQGFSGTPGTHIVFLDFSHFVDIQVHTADTFVVHNGASFANTGNVTLVW